MTLANACAVLRMFAGATLSIRRPRTTASVPSTSPTSPCVIGQAGMQGAPGRPGCRLDVHRLSGRRRRNAPGDHGSEKGQAVWSLRVNVNRKDVSRLECTTRNASTGTELGLGHHGRDRPATDVRRAGMAAGLGVRTLPDEVLRASAAGWRCGAGCRTPGHVGQETAAG